MNTFSAKFEAYVPRVVRTTLSRRVIFCLTGKNAPQVTFVCTIEFIQIALWLGFKTEKYLEYNRNGRSIRPAVKLEWNRSGAAKKLG